MEDNKPQGPKPVRGEAHIVTTKVQDIMKVWYIFRLHLHTQSEGRTQTLLA